MSPEVEEVEDLTPQEDADTATAEAIRSSHPLLKGPVVQPRTDEEMEAADVEEAEEEAEEEVSGANGAPTAEDLQAELEAKEEEWAEQRRGITGALRGKDRELKETNARLASIEAVLERQAAAAKPVEAAPDPNVDPAGAAAYEARKAREETGELRKGLEASEAQKKQLAQVEQWNSQIEADEEEFSAEHDDYEDAANHWTDVKIAEARALGQTDEQIQESLALVDLQLAAHLKAKGVTLAQFKYAQAKVYGWAPGSGNGDGEAEAAPKAAAAKPGSGKVAAVAEKLAKSKTLSAAAPGASGETVKLKEVLKGKSIGEFNAILDAKKKELGVSERELTQMIEEDEI